MILIHETGKGLSWWRDGVREPVKGGENVATFAWDAKQSRIVITEDDQFGMLSSIGLDGARRHIVTVDGELRYPAIAPDGRIVVSFLERRSRAQWQLLEISFDGPRVKQRSLGLGALPTFCADGSMYFVLGGDTDIRVSSAGAILQWLPGLNEPMRSGFAGDTPRCLPDGRLLVSRPDGLVVRGGTKLTQYFDRFASMTGNLLVVSRSRNLPFAGSSTVRELVLVDLAASTEHLLLDGHFEAEIVP